MQVLQNLVQKQCFFPIDGNGTTVTATACDLAATGLIGCKELMAIVDIGNIAADMTTLKWQESGVSNFASDTADVATFTAPTGAAGDGKTWTAFAPTGGARKRYHRIVATCGAAATLISAKFIGYGGNQAPNSATERGITGEQVIATS